jgi:hypothetical protein
MWVIPEGFRTSTRVVTSKVRQPVEVAASAKSGTALESARPTHVVAVCRRNSRLFIRSSSIVIHVQWIGWRVETAAGRFRRDEFK